MAKKIGLCLGSGGARGFCHIGVIDRLIAENFSFSEISGSSIGAIVGAFLALGKYDHLKKIASSFNSYKYLQLQDPTFPFKGVIKGKKIEKFLIEELGDVSFSDLKIPLKIVATDLKTGNEVVFTKGKLIPAIRASISIPGVFEYYNSGKDHLVDGGLCNPLPVNILKTKKIVAVDLYSNCNYFDEDNLNILNILLQSFSILEKNFISNFISQVSLKKTVILKPFINSGFLDFSNPKKLINSGYMCCDEHIDEINKLTKGFF